MTPGRGALIPLATDRGGGGEVAVRPPRRSAAAGVDRFRDPARRRLERRAAEVCGLAALEAGLRELGDDLIGPIDPLDLTSDCARRLRATRDRAARLAADRALATLLDEIVAGIADGPASDEACDLLPILDRAFVQRGLGVG